MPTWSPFASTIATVIAARIQSTPRFGIANRLRGPVIADLGPPARRIGRDGSRPSTIPEHSPDLRSSARLHRDAHLLGSLAGTVRSPCERDRDVPATGLRGDAKRHPLVDRGSGAAVRA